MRDPDPQAQADPALVEAWLTARSALRGLPAPVADHGGLRVDTGLPQERRRHVFARPGPGLRVLGETIFEPDVFLKACAPAAALQAMLPERWALQADRTFMTLAGEMSGPPAPQPEGYRLERLVEAGATKVRILTDIGDVAASGRAGAHDGVFIYDQIETMADHRRRGLGGAVMASLQAVRPPQTRIQALVATADGRALYESLGWSVHAPYSTAVIPRSHGD